MYIEKMDWKVIKIALKKPFRIALGTIRDYEGVFIRICTSSTCGYGEASPSPKITGDTTGSTLAALSTLKPLLIGEDPRNIGKIMRKINSQLIGNSTAKAAIDMALYDLFGKLAKTPVNKMFGGISDKIETSLTVDIGSIEDSLKSATTLLDAGAKVLKVKIGLNPDRDVELIRKIREISDVNLRVDANQGYNLKMAVKVLNKISRYEIQFAEQPIPVSSDRDFEILRQMVEIPIMADESVHNSRDVLRLVDKVDAINIKLMKSGGMHEALKMAAIARAAGMKIMVGCMIETKLGIAAGTHFATGIGAEYADLDGYWDLNTNPVTGIIFEDGFNMVPEKDGLGVKVDINF